MCWLLHLHKIMLFCRYVCAHSIVHNAMYYSLYNFVLIGIDICALLYTVHCMIQYRSAYSYVHRHSAGSHMKRSVCAMVHQTLKIWLGTQFSLPTPELGPLQAEF